MSEAIKNPPNPCINPLGSPLVSAEEEAVLIRKAQDGDQDAIDRLIRSHQRLMKSLAKGAVKAATFMQPGQTPNLPKLMRTPAAAEYINSTESTMTKMRCNGTGPKFIRIGGAVNYSKESLDEYIRLRTFRSTTEADCATVCEVKTNDGGDQ